MDTDCGFRAVDLYCFSGTGNTLLVAQAMRNEFELRGIEVVLRRLETADPKAVRLDRVLGLAFTVAAQGTYPLVWRFVEALPRCEGVPVFMADTMMGFSGGVVGPMRQIVERKGFRPLGAREFIMPNNVLPRDPGSAKNAAKVRAGVGAAREYAADLVAGRSHWGRIPVLSDMMSVFSRGEWLWRASRKLFPLRVSPERCTRCGQCVRMCPVEDIKLDDLPVFGGQCCACMRCISFCPTQAISIRGWKGRPYRAVDADCILDPRGRKCEAVPSV